MTLDSFRILQEFRCRLLILIKISLSTGAPVFFKNSGRNSAHKSSWLRLWFYKKNYQNASVHCTVPCIVLRHIIIMVICTSSSSSELSINQNGVSMVKGKDIYIPTHRHTTVHCSMTNHSDLLLIILSTAFCDLS